jgi:hypothetical protein
MALDAQILLSILAHETSSGDISQTLRVTPATYSLALSDGTGANQAQIAWSDSRTATTANDDLVVTSLADTRDGASVTVAFSSVKIVYVRNKSANSNLLLGLSGITNFGGFPQAGGFVPSGGCYFIAAPSDAGITVLAGHVARLRADSGTADYDIILIGEGTVT